MVATCGCWSVNGGSDIEFCDLHAGVADAAAKVLEGFDRKVFVRDTSNDDSAAWAIRQLPYLGALGVLARLLAPDVAPTESPAEGGDPRATDEHGGGA
jgi:hypothetical protein